MHGSRAQPCFNPALIFNNSEVTVLVTSSLDIKTIVQLKFDSVLNSPPHSGINRVLLHHQGRGYVIKPITIKIPWTSVSVCPLNSSPSGLAYLG